MLRVTDLLTNKHVLTGPNLNNTNSKNQHIQLLNGSVEEKVNSLEELK